MPTVFITVDCAINQLAAATSADRVLVHAAAGGVGLAAMQIIAAAGATAVTTAGSPAKRALLRTLGSAHVSSSRDTAFVSELTEVGGVSVVLNSLTSSGMVAGSLAALDVGGRFVEISKRDIWSAARIAQGKPGSAAAATTACLFLPSPTTDASRFLHSPSCSFCCLPAERPDVHYSLVAVDFMSEHALHAALSRVAGGVSAGALRPLPQVLHSLSAVQAALRQMSQARHVGKVVVRAPALLEAQQGATSGSGQSCAALLMHFALDIHLSRRASALSSHCL
jgi:NADPH:quinone reductase-like Zn-dependent oxidoreductase